MQHLLILWESFRWSKHSLHTSTWPLLVSFAHRLWVCYEVLKWQTAAKSTTEIARGSTNAVWGSTYYAREHPGLIWWDLKTRSYEMHYVSNSRPWHLQATWSCFCTLIYFSLNTLVVKAQWLWRTILSSLQAVHRSPSHTDMGLTCHQTDRFFLLENGNFITEILFT